MLSPAEMLTAVLARPEHVGQAAGRCLPPCRRTAPLGPEDRRGSAEGRHGEGGGRRSRAARDAERVLKETATIPAAVRLGAAELAPSALFTAAAVALQRLAGRWQWQR